MENENIMLEEENVETYEETENSGHGGLTLVAGVILVGGAVAGILYKNRKKLEARKIEKLRKKGYVIYDPTEEDDSVSDETEE